MSLLKPNKKKENHIGGYPFPPIVNAYLTLYSLAFKISKTEIIRRAVNEWVDKTKQKSNDNSLLNMIIDNAKKQWIIQKTHNITITQFKELLKTELSEKGISSNYIRIILSEIK